MKKICLFFCLISLSAFTSKAQDTLFAMVQKDKLFIPHVVLPKQNLYRISRYYSSSVVDIKILNALQEDTLKIGSILKIPLIRKNFTIHPNKNKIDVKYSPVFLMANNVKNIRMLMAAVPYEQDDFESFLKKKKTVFNNKESCLIGYVELRNTSLVPLVEKKGVENPTPNIEPKADTTMRLSIVDSTKKNPIKDCVTVIKRPTQLKLLEKLYSKSEAIEQMEKGPALSFSVDSLGNFQKGFYALHNTLPVGTIVKLKNPMNENEVYVKILGKIPEIAGNQRCIIKVSREASIYLDAKDERFLVEIFYHQ
ncbi:MAG: hypothetical protein RL065_1999 [Bacteroidota bacterium]|jgi:LysM repeat protein